MGGLASTPFDSEGVRTSDADIIKDGVLQEWLLTSYSARKLGLKSNGHAGAFITGVSQGKASPLMNC